MGWVPAAQPEWILDDQVQNSTVDMVDLPMGHMESGEYVVVEDSLVEQEEMDATEDSPKGQAVGLGDAYREGVVTPVAVVLGSGPKVDGTFVHAIVKVEEGIVGSPIVHSQGPLRRSRPDRHCWPVLGTMVDPVEPRQSERIKRKQSGDEDLV